MLSFCLIKLNTDFSLEVTGFNKIEIRGFGSYLLYLSQPIEVVVLKGQLPFLWMQRESGKDICTFYSTFEGKLIL